MPQLRELEVSLSGTRVGTLRETRKGARFAYDEDIVGNFPAMPVLSASLPVKRRPYSEGKTGAWFRGLLPEGERLAALCRRIRCSTADYLGILAEIGWECAGAVSVIDPAAPPKVPGMRAEVTLEELGGILAELPVYETSGPVVQRVSLDRRSAVIGIRTRHSAVTTPAMLGNYAPKRANGI